MYCTALYCTALYCTVLYIYSRVHIMRVHVSTAQYIQYTSKRNATVCQICELPFDKNTSHFYGLPLDSCGECRGQGMDGTVCTLYSPGPRYGWDCMYFVQSGAKVWMGLYVLCTVRGQGMDGTVCTLYSPGPRYGWDCMYFVQSGAKVWMGLYVLCTVSTVFPRLDHVLD